MSHADPHAHDDHGHGHAHDAAHGGHDHAHGHDDHAHAHGDAHGADDHDDHHAAEPEVVAAEPLGQPRKEVAVEDVTFSLIDEGSGPPILFLHGFPTTCALWRGPIEELSKTFRCIAPDLVGFGDTDAPVAGPYGFAQQAALLVKLMDALGVTGEFAVVGHDLGTGIAETLAAAAPERISKLVLLNGPAPGSPIPPVVTRLRLAAKWSWVWDLAADTGFLRWFAASAAGFRAGAYDPATLSDEAIAEYTRSLYMDTPPAYRAGRERFRRGLIEYTGQEYGALLAIEDRLRRFEKPTVVVWGCDDPYFSVSWAKKLADMIPGCVGLELIPFCGHWVPEEKPAALAALIGSHLNAASAVPMVGGMEVGSASAVLREKAGIE